MKTKLLLLLSLLLIIFPVSAEDSIEEVNKLQIINKDNIELNKKYNSSVFASGNSIKNEGIVLGLNILLGNYVSDSSISEYSIILGQTVELNSEISNDALIVGNYIKSNSNVRRDAILYGSIIDLTGTYNREVKLYGDSINLSNVIIEGDLYVRATSLSIGDNVKVNGTITYNDDLKVTGDISSFVTSTYEIEQSSSIISFLINLGSTLVLFLVLALVMPKIFTMCDKNIDSKDLLYPISLIGKGAFTLILFPILIILLFSLYIGTYISLGLILLFFVILG
ncbi:MAG: hypothetical protein IJZ36_01965, partial [Bacilli bacterium]|nr:hypothetical protein [Bacilli bacterium]